MKSSLALTLLILFVFAADSLAQTRTINFDLRTNSGDASGFAGTARLRTVKSTNGSAASSTAASIEQQVFELINGERAKNGLSQLEWNESLAELARLHSQDMAKQKFFSHRGSDGSMIDDRADRLGLGVWRSIGENIAYMRGYDDPAALAVEKWLESAAHRKNLLGPNWKESAVGVAVTSDGTYYMTEVFLLRK